MELEVGKNYVCKYQEPNSGSTGFFAFKYLGVTEEQLPKWSMGYAGLASIHLNNPDLISHWNTTATITPVYEYEDGTTVSGWTSSPVVPPAPKKNYRCINA